MAGPRAALLVLLVVLGVAGLAGPAGAAQQPLPPQGTPPPGANNFSCKPPPLHPYPVVLVHGTFANMTISWNAIAPDLERLGYCVFALDYGNSPIRGINATGDIPTSARELQTFIDHVLTATGAAKVSIVGHSQGGMMPRYYIKFLGGAAKVDDLVGLSPSNHGTTNPLASPAAPFCPACGQQVAGSSFLRNLNAGDQIPSPVDYTVIETNHDEVVTPYQSEFLPTTPDGRVTNILLQDRCPSDLTEHVGIIYDPVAIQWMLNALGRPGPADPNFKPDCSGAALAHFPNTSSVASPGGGSHGSPRGRLAIDALRRGHGSLAVTLSAPAGPVSRVVVVLRLGHRVLARSGSVIVSGRRRVVLHLRRALGSARYVLTASGRDRAGRAVRASRAFRVSAPEARHAAPRFTG